MELREGNIFTLVYLLECPHVTIIYDTLEPTVQHPPPAMTSQTSDLGPPARDIWWPSLETYSNLFICGPPIGTDIWWPKLAQLASGRYASYLNIVVCIVIILACKAVLYSHWKHWLARETCILQGLGFGTLLGSAQ